jgi:ligand-binding SRPBCC domain-containing protein
MASIELVTRIDAPPERCFDLSRDVGLHLRSMAHTGERAIGGRVSGLLELGDEVTWEGRHFGVLHQHTSRITGYDRPRWFRDSMVHGRFARFDHDHFFEPSESGTVMRDVLDFESPLGLLGRFVDRTVLVRYLEKLLRERNRVIRSEAQRES